MIHRSLWLAYRAFGAAYQWLWKRRLIKPGGNLWHRVRAGFRTPREDRPLWLHAASLGEVRVAQAYRESLSDVWPLYLTIQTDAGFRAAVAAFGSTQVGYAPVDHPHGVARFLQSVKPRGLVVSKRKSGRTGCCTSRAPCGLPIGDFVYT